MIVEADESDRSFLRLSPSIAVITNVDDEHMESYGTLDHLCDAFVNFANRVPFYGLVAVCADDESLREQASRISRRVRTYGVDAQDADLFAFDIEEQAFGSTCSVSYKPFGERERVLLGTLRLQVPGLHNIRNSLGAMIVGLEIGLNFTQVTATLAEFSGVERRFQRLGEADGVLVVDDYGHHPTEIAAVMHTARQQIKRRMLVVVQPHRFTRVSRLMSQFGSVLAGADEVILTEVYAAGETPMPGATSEVLAEVIGQFSESPVHLVRSLDEVVTRVGQLAKRGDLVITFGAGSISGVAGRIFHHLQQRQQQDADVIEANYG
jgi:UDP-N-acetylmuramate--alanine ligase